MRKLSNRALEAERLEVGDLCWYDSGGLMYVAEVTAARVILEGDPCEFVMYDLKLHHREVKSAHRSELYRCRDEREDAVDHCREKAEAYEQYAGNLSTPDDNDPDGEPIFKLPELGDDV